MSFLLAFPDRGSGALFVRSRADTALEVLALRQQLGVLKRTRPRPRLGAPDRLFWVVLQQLWSRRAEGLIIVNPDTVVVAFVSCDPQSVLLRKRFDFRHRSFRLEWKLWTSWGRLAHCTDLQAP